MIDETNYNPETDPISTQELRDWSIRFNTKHQPIEVIDLSPADLFTKSIELEHRILRPRQELGITVKRSKDRQGTSQYSYVAGDSVLSLQEVQDRIKHLEHYDCLVKDGSIGSLLQAKKLAQDNLSKSAVFRLDSLLDTAIDSELTRYATKQSPTTDTNTLCNALMYSGSPLRLHQAAIISRAQSKEKSDAAKRLFLETYKETFGEAYKAPTTKPVGLINRIKTAWRENTMPFKRENTVPIYLRQQNELREQARVGYENDHNATLEVQPYAHLEVTAEHNIPTKDGKIVPPRIPADQRNFFNDDTREVMVLDMFGRPYGTEEPSPLQAGAYDPTIEVRRV